jgi:hypothetical protein
VENLIGGNAMDQEQLKRTILEVARECLEKGPGWAQEGVVLREVAERLGGSARNEQDQQKILTCWHDLFLKGELSWGFNLDNPNAPWFHVPRRAG